MRLGLLPFVLVTGGCVCFQPVDESADAGFSPDAGTMDAAADVPGGTDCMAPVDCRGTPRVTSWCTRWLGGGDAGFSCVDQKCIAQCGASAGQTCVRDDAAGCFRCPPMQPCSQTNCLGLDNFRFTIEELACVGPPPLRVNDFIIITLIDGGCGSSLTLASDAGNRPLGTLVREFGLGLRVTSQMLGGTCVAQEVPSGAYRLLLDCPSCQIALGP